MRFKGVKGIPGCSVRIRGARHVGRARSRGKKCTQHRTLGHTTAHTHTHEQVPTRQHHCPLTDFEDSRLLDNMAVVWSMWVLTVHQCLVCSRPNLARQHAHCFARAAAPGHK